MGGAEDDLTGTPAWWSAASAAPGFESSAAVVPSACRVDVVEPLLSATESDLGRLVGSGATEERFARFRRNRPYWLYESRMPGAAAFAVDTGLAVDTKEATPVDAIC
jgi:hypothetical protein